MRRILISLVIISLFALVVFGATQAYFSDTETSTGNTFTAGTLDLNVDGGNTNVVKFTVPAMEPGSQQQGIYTLNNVGTINGYLDLENIMVVGNENGCLDPESDVGDLSCGNPGSGEGELQDVVNLKIFWDASCNGLGGGDDLFYDDYVGNLPANFEEDKLLNTGSSVCVTFLFNWSSTASDNQAQGDDMTLDVEFELAQTVGQ